MGKDKLKRPKRWEDWLREVENKMRFGGITDSTQKLNFMRSCAGAELTKLWEKQVRVVYEATREGAAAVAAHTYEQVIENTKTTLLKSQAGRGPRLQYKSALHGCRSFHT